MNRPSAHTTFAKALSFSHTRQAAFGYARLVKPGNLGAADKHPGDLSSSDMPCLLTLIAVFFPRLVIAGLFLFSSFLHDAYQTWYWPLLGFLFMPFTTLGYAAAVNVAGGVTGLWIVLIILTVLMDLGQASGAAKR